MKIRHSIRRTFGGWMLAAGAAVPLAYAPPLAAQSAQLRFDMPSGDLADALSAFAAQAGVKITADPAVTQDKTTRGLRGNHTVDQGFALLLAGTGLERVITAGGENALRVCRWIAKTTVASLHASTRTQAFVLGLILLLTI